MNIADQKAPARYCKQISEVRIYIEMAVFVRHSYSILKMNRYFLYPEGSQYINVGRKIVDAVNELRC